MRTTCSFARAVRGAFAFLAFAALAAAQACGGGGEQAGQPCDAPADCYPGIDPADLEGEIRCLDKGTGGYCTHLCDTDADCCAVAGECLTGHPQVCSPFESTGLKMCFLSCEDQVLDDLDDDAYCRQFANAGFVCRSTGGGAENRRVCLP